MTKIKLCGLSRIEDIEAANTLKPDFIGFVFAAKSKRRVSHLKAAELKSKLNPGTKAVGVFLDDDLDTVGALMNLGIVDMVQLQRQRGRGIYRKAARNHRQTDNQGVHNQQRERRQARRGKLGGLHSARRRQG